MSINGLMDQSISVTGQIMHSMEEVLSSGMMVACTLVIGVTT